MLVYIYIYIFPMPEDLRCRWILEKDPTYLTKCQLKRIIATYLTRPQHAGQSPTNIEQSPS